MNRVGLLDTSISSDNLGDEIIVSAIMEQLTEVGLTQIMRLPTHRRWNENDLAAAEAIDLFLVAGTNLLGSRPVLNGQWPLGFREFGLLRGKVILFGVGWRSYNVKSHFFNRKFYEELLSKRYIHGLRDSFTQDISRKIPRQFLNISCPTLWNAPSEPRKVPVDGSTVLVTLTDYRRDREKDSMLIKQLQSLYHRLLFWPQGSQDKEYAKSISSRLEILPRTLDSFDNALEQASAYVGTRLHAGIRALQAGVPHLIISVDNRTTEISRDTGINSLDRAELLNSRIEDEIRYSKPILPEKNILTYIEQLRSIAARNSNS